jgi:nucleoside-diphosphate-sugar epimerase
MNILITGVNSFVGRNLGRYLSECGHNVYGTVRNPLKAPSEFKWLIRSFIYEMGTFPEPSLFTGIDIVIHLIYDFRPNQMELNIHGTRQLCLAAKQNGVDYQFFVSSYSARKDAISEYGRTKYTLERFFLKEHGFIIRPGLVLGDGGLFKKMVTLVQKFPVLPLIEDGNGLVPIVDINTLCQAINVVISNKDKVIVDKDFNLFHPELISLKYLLQQISHAAGNKVIFIKVPARLLLLPLDFLRRVGIKLPVTSDNLKGYIINRNILHVSSLNKILQDVPSVNYMIQNAVSFIITRK